MLFGWISVGYGAKHRFPFELPGSRPVPTSLLSATQRGALPPGLPWPRGPGLEPGAAAAFGCCCYRDSYSMSMYLHNLFFSGTDMLPRNRELAPNPASLQEAVR